AVGHGPCECTRRPWSDLPSPWPKRPWTSRVLQVQCRSRGARCTSGRRRWFLDVVDLSFEHGRGLEAHHPSRGQGDPFAGARVESGTLAFVPDDEVAKARDLDLVSGSERLFHRLEDDIYEVLRFLLREAPDGVVHALDDLGLGHRMPSVTDPNTDTLYHATTTGPAGSSAGRRRSPVVHP